MVLVYTEELTNRHAYIVELILSNLLGVPYALCASVEELATAEGPCVNYSGTRVEGAVQIIPAGLLSTTGIKALKPEVTEYKGVKVLFGTEGGALPYDIFSAAFYMVSRYEEYLPYQADVHERFEASQSLAWQNGFLKIPVVNMWAGHLRAVLQEHYPAYPFTAPTYTFIPTFDIDNAYAYKHKNALRQFGGIARQAISGNYKALAERVLVGKGERKDPYDTYTKQEEIHSRYNLLPVYFWLLGNYATYDKNIPHTSQAMQALIRRMSACESGIHPSYASKGQQALLTEEKQRLEHIINKKVNCSRQHYIRLTMPDTYRFLIAAGIEKDYSMGFATQPGFRAGICSSFYFYDLLKEEKTNLKVVPFAFMDTNLRQLATSPEEALALVDPIIKAVKDVNGLLCTLFHNESLGGSGVWQGWQNLYEDVVRRALA
jgi:hypothetical protein